MFTIKGRWVVSMQPCKAVDSERSDELWRQWFYGDHDQATSDALADAWRRSLIPSKPIYRIQYAEWGLDRLLPVLRRYYREDFSTEAEALEQYAVARATLKTTGLVDSVQHWSHEIACSVKGLAKGYKGDTWHLGY